MTENKNVEVKNNSTGSVSYYSEYSRMTRKWDKPDTVKQIPLEELRELVGVSGGYELLESYLLIKDVEVREELGLPTEKEFMLDGKEINALMKKPISTLEETLEVVPDAIKDKIAQAAIDNKLADLDKLELIKDHTGIDVLSAVKEKKEEEKTSTPTKTTKKKK